MKKVVILCLILALSVICGCSNEPQIPEHYGIYARLDNGSLVELERIDNHYTSKLIFVNNSNEVSMHELFNASLYSYVTEMPSTSLNMKRIKGFIVYGEKQIQKETGIYYFSRGNSIKAKFFDNKGPGNTNEKTFIALGYYCGIPDGMKYKKINEDMYLFQYPVDEKSEYKFCDLSKEKKYGEGTETFPITRACFYAWWYNDTYWAFKTD